MDPNGHLRVVSIAVLIVGLAIAWPVSPAVAAGAEPGWSLTATTSTTNLRDGQSVTLNLKTGPDVTAYQWFLRQCRLVPADGTYDTQEDFATDAGNCTQGNGLSSSGDYYKARGTNLSTSAAQPAGASLSYRIGIGKITLTAAPGQPAVDLVCDPSTPCALVSVLYLSGGNKPLVATPVTFSDSNPLSSCGGAAADAVSAGGSDRFIDAWSAWTVSACARPNQAGAVTRMSFGGEGEAVDSFTGTTADLVYTGVGYSPSAGLGPEDAAEQRPAVLTPVALNAAVIAVANGYFTPTGDKAPYPEVKLTPAEVADLLSGGVPWLRDMDGDAVRARNPLLKPDLAVLDMGVSAHWFGSSESTTTHWVMTRHLEQVAADHWRTPQRNNSAPRTVGPSIILSQPEFSSDAFTPLTGRGAFEKAIVPNQASLLDGPMWFLTDLVTAKALGLATVSIANAAGEFVAPTADSLRAAVPTMTKDEHGARVPTPGATAPAGQVQPYPLTFVEYAMAPAQPLTDVDCNLRTAAQAHLADWLSFITTTGQSLLPDGFVPVTPELANEAAAAIPKVGASPLTGACTPAPTTTTTTTVTATPTTQAVVVPPPALPFDPPTEMPSNDTGDAITTRTGSSPASVPPSGGGASLTSSPPPADAPTGPATTAPVPATGTPTQSLDPVLPEYAGSRSASGQTALLALVGIVLLSTVGALATSGRGPRPRAPQWFTRRAGAAVPAVDIR